VNHFLGYFNTILYGTKLKMVELYIQNHKRFNFFGIRKMLHRNGWIFVT